MTVTSQHNDLPLCHGTSVRPSRRFPSARNNPVGSFIVVVLAEAKHRVTNQSINPWFLEWPKWPKSLQGPLKCYRQKDFCSKNVFNWRLKDCSVGAEMMCSGREFQIWAAATGKACDGHWGRGASLTWALLIIINHFAAVLTSGGRHQVTAYWLCVALQALISWRNLGTWNTCNDFGLYLGCWCAC